MNEPPIAVLAGATGAVGSRLLDLLLARKDGTRVLTVGRRAPPGSHPRLEHLEASLDEFTSVLRDRRSTEAFCCLGTTIKQAGSRAAFRAVDLDGVVAFARAARASGARFFGLVSSAGANPLASNFYLRTKGEAEELMRSSGVEATILRCPLIIGEPSRPGPTTEAFLSHDNRPIRAIGDGRQLVAPLFAGDLVSMIVAAISGEGPAGTFELGGPETMPVDDLIHIVNHPDISVRYTSVLLAAALVPVSKQLTSALVGVMGSDSVPIDNPVESAAAFGVSLTPIDTVWPQVPLGG